MMMAKSCNAREAEKAYKKYRRKMNQEWHLIKSSAIMFRLKQLEIK